MYAYLYRVIGLFFSLGVVEIKRFNVFGLFNIFLI